MGNPNEIQGPENGIYKTKVSKKMFFKSLIVFLAVLFVTESFLYLSREFDISTKKNNVSLTSAIALDKFSDAFDKIESKMKSIAAFSIDSEGKVSEFERAATSIVGENYVVSVALAPNDTVSYVFPKYGTGNVFEKEFYDNSLKTNLEKVKESNSDRKTMILGPYLHSDGKTYMGVRMPVFLDNGNAEPELWGYVYAVIDFPGVLYKEGFEIFTAREYYYILARTDIQYQEKRILSFNEDKIEDGVEVNSKVLNQDWKITAEPKKGWSNPLWYTIGSVFMALVSMLVALLVIDYYRLRATGKMLARLVNIDTLTGAFSRKYLFHYVQSEIRRGRRFAICYVDVDRFKDVNDKYGHETGDRLLVEIVEKMKECIRVNDFIARVGGDEFVIFISDINDMFDGKVILERIEKRMSEPIVIGAFNFENKLSVGYSVFPEDGLDIEDLIQKADTYMYDMKERRRMNEND